MKKHTIGITSLNWKFRYYNDFQSFKNPTLRFGLVSLF